MAEWQSFFLFLTYDVHLRLASDTGAPGSFRLELHYIISYPGSPPSRLCDFLASITTIPRINFSPFYLLALFLWRILIQNTSSPLFSQLKAKQNSSVHKFVSRWLCFAFLGTDISPKVCEQSSTTINWKFWQIVLVTYPIAISSPFLLLAES